MTFNLKVNPLGRLILLKTKGGPGSLRVGDCYFCKVKVGLPRGPNPGRGLMVVTAAATAGEADDSELIRFP
jgi:hypothetical protein